MIKIIEHLLVQEKLTLIRTETIDKFNFRAEIIEIGRWLAYEVANTLEKEEVTVKTPLGIAKGTKLRNEKDVVVVSILRAALPMAEGIMRIFKGAQHGLIGAWRNKEPPFPVEVNYFKLPSVDDKIVIVADPMLATGNTMNIILDRIMEKGNPRRLIILNVIASRAGVENVESKHPNVEIYTCAVDEELNTDGYIVPGLGDAGDKSFGKPVP